MPMILFSLIIMLLLVPTRIHGAAFEYDLGVRPEDIAIVPERIMAGQSARIYATVHNFGIKDASGQVSFYQGPYLLGTPQAISVKAQGFADEVFMDFTVPDGPFNMLARLEGVVPSDQNSANTEAVTPLISPLPDKDRDGIPDAEDNCSSVANADQLDNDKDAMGDVCDPDDDNDGLADIDEIARGTNPKNPDTDGDGIIDSKDSRPLTADVSPLTKKDAPVVAVKAGKMESKPVSVATTSTHTRPLPQVEIEIGRGERAKVNLSPAVGRGEGEGSAHADGASHAEYTVIAPAQPAVRISPARLPKLMAAAGFSALFAGLFSFLALRMKTPRE